MGVRSYVPKLIRMTVQHRRYILKYRATINEYLDAAGQSDLQACVDCADILLAKLEQLAPGLSKGEMP